MLEDIVRILLIDDSEDDYVITRDLLEDSEHFQFSLDWANEYEIGLKRIADRAHDLYLVDYQLGAKTGLEVLSEAMAMECHAPIILLTGQGHYEMDVAAMRLGAADFLRKDAIDSELLSRSIRYALTHWRTVEALQKSEQKYRSVVNNVQEVIFQASNLLWTFLNPAWEHITGFDVDETIGRNLLDYIHPNDHHILASLSGHNQTQQMRREMRFRKKGGGYVWIQLNARISRDAERPTANRPIISLNGTLTNIDDRKQTESALRDSEIRFRTVVESLNETLLITTRDDTIVYANAPAEAIFDRLPEQIIGQKLPNLLRITDTDLEAFTTRPIAVGQSKRFEWHVHRSNNPSIWLELNATPLCNANKKIIGTLIAISDITERKRYEQNQTELVDDLESSAQAKDDFLASMSHELRTPLNAMLGKTEALTEGVYGNVNPRQHESLQLIDESGRHLLSLINDLLDLSKIEAGKIELELTSINVHQLAQASIRQVDEIAQRKQIDIYALHDEGVTTITGDERRLRQVLINLMSNAVKFTAEGGEVGIEVEGDSANQRVHLRVRDTGIGIAEADLNRLFQRFEQIPDTKLVQRGEGTGLGLDLVRRLVDLHGGEVTVESKVGEGSCFTVSLPWQPTLRQIDHLENSTPHNKENGSKPNPQVDKTHSPLILLAEDNEMNITMLSDYLRVKGYLVEVARDGVEAVDMALQIRPDLVLMDMQMPRLDGLEATRIIRQKENLRDLPIIGLTALAMPGDRERCLAAGANEYMSKPVSLRSLVREINQLLAGG